MRYNRRMRFFRIDLLKGNLWVQTLLFFIPILIGAFFQQLYNTVDAIVVGQYLGPNALGAVGGSTGTLVNLFVGLFIGISSGAAVVLSHAVGAFDKHRIKHTIHTSMAIALFCSVIVTVIGFLFAPNMLKMVNVPAGMFDYSLIYLRIYFIGTVFSLIYNMGTALLRSLGDSKRPLYFLIVSCFVNIVLDLLFVVQFKMGVEGVAIATVISQVVSCVLVVMTMVKMQDPYRLYFHEIRINMNLLKQILWIGFPAAMQSVLYTISNLVIAWACNGYGEVVAAANAAYGKIDGLYWMIIGALGTTVTTIVGQNYGAKNTKRVQQSLYIAWLYSALMSIGASLVFMGFGEWIFTLFTNDPIVIEEGMNILNLMAPWLISYCTIEIIAGALRGVGNVIIPTIVTLVGVVGMRVIWVMMTSGAASVTVPLACYPISWTLTSLIFILYFYGFRKGRVSDD